jgi:predicted nucleic acid-binding protein
LAFSVFLDACVLHKAYLRDLLLRLAEAETYRPLWSQDVLQEVRASLVRREFAEDSVDYTIGEMVREFEDACVEGYEALIPVMTSPDPDDRHVMAAAVRGLAAVIVTDNVKDFPAASTEPYQIEVKTSDEFLLDQLDLHPEVVLQTLSEQVQDYERPHRDLASLLERLEREGVARFATEARQLATLTVPAPPRQ